MFIIVRKDEEVLAQLEPGAVLTWIGLGVSEATEHRYAVQFETMTGATRCAELNGANVHTIGDWDNAEHRSGDGRSVGSREHGPASPWAGESRRSTPAFACSARDVGPASRLRPQQPEAHERRRDSRRAGRDPYLTPFRVIVNKFAT